MLTVRGALVYALTLDLLDPRGVAALSEVVLRVLVEGEAKELTVDDRLGVVEGVPIGGHVADHLGAGRREVAVDLLNGVAEVVAVGARVTQAEDSHGLAAKVKAVDLLKEVIPGSGRALLVGAGVPGGGADNEGVVLRQGVGPVHLRDVLGLSAQGLGDQPGDLLGLARDGPEEHAHGVRAHEPAPRRRPRARARARRPPRDRRHLASPPLSRPLRAS